MGEAKALWSLIMLPWLCSQDIHLEGETPDLPQASLRSPLASLLHATASKMTSQDPKECFKNNKLHGDFWILLTPGGSHVQCRSCSPQSETGLFFFFLEEFLGSSHSEKK